MIDVFNFTCLNLPELSYNIEMKLHFGTIANIFTIKDSPRILGKLRAERHSGRLVLP